MIVVIISVADNFLRQVKWRELGWPCGHLKMTFQPKLCLTTGKALFCERNIGLYQHSEELAATLCSNG